MSRRRRTVDPVPVQSNGLHRNWPCQWEIGLNFSHCHYSVVLFPVLRFRWFLIGCPSLYFHEFELIFSLFLLAVKIGIFYTIFYGVLAALVAICMWVFFQTLDPRIPKWKLNKSLIGTNPGKITFIDERGWGVIGQGICVMWETRRTNRSTRNASRKC